MENITSGTTETIPLTVTRGCSIKTSFDISGIDTHCKATPNTNKTLSIRVSIKRPSIDDSVVFFFRTVYPPQVTAIVKYTQCSKRPLDNIKNNIVETIISSANDLSREIFSRNKTLPSAIVNIGAIKYPKPLSSTEPFIDAQIKVPQLIATRTAANVWRNTSRRVMLPKHARIFPDHARTKNSTINEKITRYSTNVIGEISLN